MPDGSLECLLGRMEQKICDIKTDLEEIKEEQKRLAIYIDTQRIGVKVLLAFSVAIGSVLVYWKEHLEKIFVSITKS
jgi:hypothetical protein